MIETTEQKPQSHALFEITSRCLDAYGEWSKECLGEIDWCDSKASKQLEAIAADVKSGRLALAFSDGLSFEGVRETE